MGSAEARALRIDLDFKGGAGRGGVASATLTWEFGT
jgi:hypothetical protein